MAKKKDVSAVVAAKVLRHPEPTITPIVFDRNYNQSLIQARDAMGLDGYVEKEINDKNFPSERRDGDREFVLVCFSRDIYDHPAPESSEVMREFGRLGLEPEGAMELCFVGADPRTRDLQRKFLIVARRQIWQHPRGRVYCPILDGSLFLDDVYHRRNVDHHFLCSRK